MTGYVMHWLIPTTKVVGCRAYRGARRWTEDPAEVTCKNCLVLLSMTQYGRPR